MQGWRTVSEEQRPCWDNGAWANDGARFFREAERGADCDRNWYEGNPGALGRRQGGPTNPWVRPRFTEDFAPAILGFDESIDHLCGNHDDNGWFHGAACVEANYNILSLYPPAQYSACQPVQHSTGILSQSAAASLR